MSTDCHQQTLPFQPHFRQEIRAAFTGFRISSDGGALLLREVAQRTGLLDAAAACFADHRQPWLVAHDLPCLIAQRILGLCLGYEDLNDHDFLQGDALLALACGRRDHHGTQRRGADHGKPLASSSTLNRLELAVPHQGDDTPVVDRYHKVTFDPVAGQALFTTAFAASQTRPPKQVILDLDATDDALHGDQEGRFFHGYYDHYCYLPLYIFAGSHLLWAELRQSNQDGAAGSVAAVSAIVERLRNEHGWHDTEFIVRGDSGFCRDNLMSWCEQHNVHFILGLAKNSRLKAITAKDMYEVESEAVRDQERVTRFARFTYRTRKSWSRRRCVTAKVEALPSPRADDAIKRNHRFIVSSLPASRHEPEELYRNWYCPRGDMENRIKEQQLDLFADRTSTARMWSNQIRLWFASVAYCLMDALRRTALAKTALAKAQCGTIRLRLLKIGATIRTTARKVWIALSSAHPAEPIFRQAAAALWPP